MSDTGDRPDSVRSSSARAYHAAHSDPKWAVHELLTDALGTLRAIAIPLHTGEQAAAAAAESISRIDQAVAKKLTEIEGGDYAR